MKRLRCLFLLGLTLVALVGCGDEITRTQLTVRIDAPDDLIRMTSGIRLTVRRENGPAAETFPVTTSTLWPMDLHVVPQGNNDADDLVDVTVEAIAKDNQAILVRQRRLIAFKRKSKLVLPIRLERCGANDYGFLCADTTPSCSGADCLTCVMGTCMRTPTEPGIPWTEDAGEHDPVDRSDGGLDAAPDGAPDADASDADGSMDANPRDADADADASDADGHVDPDVDADADAGDAHADSGPIDCGCHDAYVPPEPVDCTAAPSWVSASPNLPIPPGAVPYSRVQIPSAGDFYNQYVCRSMSEFGNVSGKVNATTNGASSVAFELGCWHAVPGDPIWLSKPSDAVEQVSKAFQILAPVSGCVLNWQDSSAQGLPAKAVVTGRDNLGVAIYSCQFNISEPESTGAHIGRVSATPGDVCTTQFFGSVRTAAPPFKVLVQTAP